MVRTVIAWLSAILASVIAGCAIGLVAFHPDLAEPQVVLVLALTVGLLVAVAVRARPRRRLGSDSRFP